MLRRSRTLSAEAVEQERTWYEQLDKAPSESAEIRTASGINDVPAETNKCIAGSAGSACNGNGFENNAASTSNKLSRSSLDEAELNQKQFPSSTAALEENISQSSVSLKPKFSTDHVSLKRSFRGLSKLKWASFEELKESRPRAGNSIKSARHTQKTEPNQDARSVHRLQKHGRKCVSLELDSQECFPEETRLDQYCRRKIRRGGTCEELEKTMFYQGCSSHKLREVIVVNENLEHVM